MIAPEFGTPLALMLGKREQDSVAGIEADVEALMKPEWNENMYAKQFDGSLQRSPKARPVPVTISVRLMTGEAAGEVGTYAGQATAAPVYVFDCGEDLPANPTVRALGRHYFTW